jgi:chemotaxis protein histidine kinase CheA
MLTIQYEKGLYVLAVADIRGEHRSVVQRLEPPLSRIPLFSGITVSPALEVIPLLDVEFIGQHLTPHVT